MPVAIFHLGTTSICRKRLVSAVSGYGNVPFGAEPFVVDFEIKAGRDRVHQAGIDSLTEVGIIFSHGHAVGFVGIEFADDVPLVRLWRFRLQARRVGCRRWYRLRPGPARAPGTPPAGRETRAAAPVGASRAGSCALVEPCCEAMRLPAMSLTPLIGLPFFTKNCAPCRRT